MPEPFVPQTDPEQGLSLTPTGPLTAADLGLAPPLGSVLGPSPGGWSVPALPMPPGVPPPGLATQLMRALALGVGVGAGPSGGTGALAAVVQQQAEEQAQRRQQQQLAYQAQLNNAIRQQAQHEAQQKIAETQYLAREKGLQHALFTIQQRVKQLPNKASYDAEIEDYAHLLQASGFRLDANWLRSAVRYTAPNRVAKISAAFDGWLKNPVNLQLMQQHPEKIPEAVIYIDRDGDGLKEEIPVIEASQIANRPFSIDRTTGQMMGYPKGTTLEDKASADGIFQSLLAKAKAEGKNPEDPTVRMSLQQQALTMAKAASTPEKDPEMAALAKESAQTRLALQQIQLGQQPSREDAQSVAHDLVTNKMAPSQLNLFGGFGLAGQTFKRLVLIEAKKLDPSFNFEEAESTYQLGKSPAFQQTVRYMDYVGTSTDRVLTNAKRLANGNVRAVTALINAGKNQVNNVDLKAFQTSVLEVSDAIAKILQGGGTGSGTSDNKLKQAQSILSTTDSPAAIAAALTEIQYLIGNRRKALTRGTYLESSQAAPPASYANPATVRPQRGQ